MLPPTSAKPVLIIAVAYKTPDLVDALIRAFLDDPAVTSQGSSVELVIADNSPDPRLPSGLPEDGPVSYMHFGDNPGYSGGARSVLTELRAQMLPGNLPYAAVALCNVDLHFECADLLKIVSLAQTHTADNRWILAPDVVEDGRAYRANPHTMMRPDSFNGRLRDRARRKSMPVDAAFRQLFALRRRHRVNPRAEQPEFTTMYAPYGAFVVFGAGYFSAGGVFHDAPLFGEEFGFGEQAHHLGVPVFWMPSMVVRHESEASVSASINGYRQRHRWFGAADSFYRSWNAADVLGGMSDWFDEGGSSRRVDT